MSPEAGMCDEEGSFQWTYFYVYERSSLNFTLVDLGGPLTTLQTAKNSVNFTSAASLFCFCLSPFDLIR